MPQFRSHANIVRPIAAVLLALCLHGCTRWSLIPEPKTLSTEPRSTVRLTIVGEAKPLIVKNPTVVGDSLLWTNPEKSGVPLSQIAWLEARAMDPVASGFFALAAATFLAVVLLRQ